MLRREIGQESPAFAFSQKRSRSQRFSDACFAFFRVFRGLLFSLPAALSG
jgi:hypothetical protein